MKILPVNKILPQVYSSALLMLFSSLLSADTSGVMNDMFDMYVNLTPGSSYETQRRGGYTLGNASFRNRVMQPNIVALDPPSFRGGCQGLDFTGGSFSFINSTQLTTMLQSIASNALSYAFTLALEGVCPTCMQKMEKLRDWVNELNGYMQDSCSIAQSMVDATKLDDWHKKKMSQSANTEVSTGAEPDHWSAIDNFISALDSDTSSGTVEIGNAVWQAMNKSNFSGWYGPFGDTDLREVIMSISGTLIVTTTKPDGTQCLNENGDPEYCIRTLPPIMTAEEFIEGSTNGPVSIYRCDNDATCASPAEALVADWPGFKEMVRVIIFGPAPTYTGGLVYKVRDGNVALTATEQSFIESAPVPIYKLFMATVNQPGTLFSIGEQVQDVVANQLARIMVFEAIEAVRLAFTSNDDAIMNEKMESMLEARVNAFRTRQDNNDYQMDKMYKLLQMVEMVAKNGVTNNPSNLPASSSNVTRTR